MTFQIVFRLFGRLTGPIMTLPPATLPSLAFHELYTRFQLDHKSLEGRPRVLYSCHAPDFTELMLTKNACLLPPPPSYHYFILELNSYPSFLRALQHQAVIIILIF